MIAVPRPPAADPLAAFTEDEVQACVDFAKPRQRWGLAGYGTDLAVLAALAVSAPGRAVVAAVAGLAGEWAPGRVVLAVVAVLAVRAGVGLPFSVRAYRQDARAGLATQRLGGFRIPGESAVDDAVQEPDISRRQMRGQFNPTQLRHGDVADYELKLVRGEQLKSGLGGIGRRAFVIIAEQVRENLSYVGFVINDENP